MSFRNYQSMSIDPASIAEGRKARATAWTGLRHWEEVPIGDDAALQRWAREGRIQPGDYLFDSRSDRCVEAKDVPALRVIFRSAAIRRLTMICRALLIGSIIILWVEPILAGLMITGAAVAAVKQRRLLPVSGT